MLDNGKAEGVRKIKRFEKYCLKDIATVSQDLHFRGYIRERRI